MWGRIEYFLRELVPVAEAAGVRLAAHPNDPPVPEMRGVASILYKPEKYRAPPPPLRHLPLCLSLALPSLSSTAVAMRRSDERGIICGRQSVCLTSSLHTTTLASSAKGQSVR